MMKRRNFAATAPAEEAEATTASPAGAPELPKAPWRRSTARS